MMRLLKSQSLSTGKVATMASCLFFWGLLLSTESPLAQGNWLTTGSADCEIGSSWCIESPKTSLKSSASHIEDELLLTYDNNKPSSMVDKLMEQFRLKAKSTDSLASIKTNMVIAHTNGQSPVALMEKINIASSEVEANLSSFFTTTQGTTSIIASNAVIKERKGRRYPLAFTGIEEVRRYTNGAGVKIGMIDTPIDILHDSLDSARIQRIELIHPGTPLNQRHGTEIAGVIVSQNPQIGIAPGASLLAVSAFKVNLSNPAERVSNAALVAKAIDISIRERVDILNLSFAGGQNNLVDRMINKAIERGIIVVASAGNGGPNAEPAYPAAIERVLAVTAIDERERIFGLANRGRYIDLSAPGVEILTTSPRNLFSLATGTSLATAHVSGVAALMLAMSRQARRQNFNARLLESTAIDLGLKGHDNEYGHGLVNIGQARAALRLPP